MTQEKLMEEVKQVRDPKAIAALYSYAFFINKGISSLPEKKNPFRNMKHHHSEFSSEEVINELRQERVLI